MVSLWHFTAILAIIVNIAGCQQEDQDSPKEFEDIAKSNSKMFQEKARNTRWAQSMEHSNHDGSTSDVTNTVLPPSQDGSASLDFSGAQTSKSDNAPHFREDRSKITTSISLLTDRSVFGELRELKVGYLNQSNIDTSPPTNQSEETMPSVTRKPIKEADTGSATAFPNVPGVVSRMSRVICCFNASSANRTGSAKFTVEDIDVNFCSDLYYDHAKIHPATYRLKEASQMDVFPVDENLFLPRFTAINDLKLKHPHLRTFLTVTDSPWATFLDVVLDSGKTEAFVQSCSRNLRLWGFDGLNLQWLYPPRPSYLTWLLERLRSEFKESDERTKTRLYLGVSLSGSVGNMEDLYQVRSCPRMLVNLCYKSTTKPTKDSRT